jgi:hypothetical protein
MPVRLLFTLCLAAFVLALAAASLRASPPRRDVTHALDDVTPLS